MADWLAERERERNSFQKGIFKKRLFPLHEATAARALLTNWEASRPLTSVLSMWSSRGPDPSRTTIRLLREAAAIPGAPFARSYSYY